MKAATISDAENVVFVLQDEIRRSYEARYDYRLHGILLIAQGLNCREVAHLLGDAPRTVAYWVGRFEDEGLSGLPDTDRPGRPRRLSPNQIEIIKTALHKSPHDYGVIPGLWDGSL